MSRPLVRVLHIHKGDKDHDGREVMDDWTLLRIDPEPDTDDILHVTTDRIRASEYADTMPTTQLGLARMVVEAINTMWMSRDRRGWSEALERWDSPPTPYPAKPYRCDKTLDLWSKP